MAKGCTLVIEEALNVRSHLGKGCSDESPAKSRAMLRGAKTVLKPARPKAINESHGSLRGDPVKVARTLSWSVVLILVLSASVGVVGAASGQEQTCCRQRTGFFALSVGPGLGHRGPIGAGALFTSVMGLYAEGQLGLHLHPSVAITAGAQFKDTEWGFEAEGRYAGGSIGVLGMVGEGLSLHGQIGVGTISHEWIPTDNPFHIRATAFPVLSIAANKMWRVTGSFLLGIGSALTYYYYYNLDGNSELGFEKNATAGERSEVDLSVFLRVAFEFPVW